MIIAAAAKSDAPCRAAVEIFRDRARIVDVGAVERSFPWYETYLKEIQVLMARAYGLGSYDPAYEIQQHAASFSIGFSRCQRNWSIHRQATQHRPFVV